LAWREMEQQALLADPEDGRNGMSFSFQSFCSGSSGNCLLLQTEDTSLLVDAGFSSMRGCREALDGLLAKVDGVLFSHLHNDHVHHYSLRVLEEEHIPVHAYEGDIPLLSQIHFRKHPFFSLKVHSFSLQPFRVGSLLIQPFRLLHDGVRATFGFDIRTTQGTRQRKAVIATDFRDWQNLETRFADADFIFVEANHDPTLLRQHPNRRSHFHLSNGNCGSLLRKSLDASKVFPRSIMLGHLSAIRNRSEIADETVRKILTGAGYGKIEIFTAPRFERSPLIRIPD
jgi:phosphoribosyl 1,2-cyclic phosphodiesterase